MRCTQDLPNYDVTVDIADNGKIGVEKFQSGNYDIILIDFLMPVMDGYQASYRIHEIDPDIPIIGLSKPELTDERHSAFTFLLKKPFRFLELKSKILELL